MARIHPVLLSGGAGSRLWPLSREGMPKQFLPLVSDRTLFQEAALRANDPETLRADPRHRQRWPPVLIAQQLQEIGLGSPSIVLEPSPRNTAAAAAIAALAGRGI